VDDEDDGFTAAGADAHFVHTDGATGLTLLKLHELQGKILAQLLRAE